MNLKRTYFIVSLALVVFYTLMCILGEDDYVSDRVVEIHAGNGQVAWMVADFHNWSKWQKDIMNGDSSALTFAGEAMMAGHEMSLVKESTQERFVVKAIYAQPNWVDQVCLERSSRVEGKGDWVESGSLRFEISNGRAGHVALRCIIQQGKVPFWFRGMIFLLGGNDQLNRWNEDNLTQIKAVLEG